MPLKGKSNIVGKDHMRHCMVVHAAYPLGETRVEREALTLRQNGYEVDVICLREAGELPFEICDGINIYRLPVKRHKGRGRIVQLLEYLNFFLLAVYRILILDLRCRYDVIQVHNLPDFLVFAAIGPKLRGARIILDLHDLMPEFFASTSSQGIHSWLARILIWQERLSCGFADHVITVTELWRESLIKRGVRPEKVSVVMNVADERFSRSATNRLLDPANNGHFELIYHGSLTKRYGLDLLVQAVGAVREEIPGIHLTIQGIGEFYEDLKALIEALNLGEQVRLNNSILPVFELIPLIKQADAGVVPNRNDIFTDSLLPTKLLELISLKVPVIASRTTGIATYFDETMVHFFTPGDVSSLADCLLDLYKNPSRRLQLVENAEKFTKRYNWDWISNEYVSLVEKLATK